MMPFDLLWCVVSYLLKFCDAICYDVSIVVILCLTINDLRYQTYDILWCPVFSYHSCIFWYWYHWHFWILLCTSYDVLCYSYDIFWYNVVPKTSTDQVRWVVIRNSTMYYVIFCDDLWCNAHAYILRDRDTTLVLWMMCVCPSVSPILTTQK